MLKLHQVLWEIQTPNGTDYPRAQGRDHSDHEGKKK